MPLTAHSTPDARTPLRPPAWLAVAALVGSACASHAAGIYTCTDSRGHKLTSDRPIAECLDREQRLLNTDGSERQRVGPSLTAEERARQDDAQRKRQAEENTRRDAVRHDRNLLGRYPNRAAHDRARSSAQEPLRKAVAAAEKRLSDLAAERQRLDAEAEFYKGQPTPAKLRQQFDHNQATVEAQRQAIKNHQVELDRITALYDEELARLQRLWAGAQPGTLGVAAGSSGVATVR